MAEANAIARDEIIERRQVTPRTEAGDSDHSSAIIRTEQGHEIVGVLLDFYRSGYGYCHLDIRACRGWRLRLRYHQGAVS